MKQTAIYFSPELDTVHIVQGEHGNRFWALSDLFYRETIESIKTLAIGNKRIENQLITDFGAGRLSAFKGLETLILVVERGVERNGAELIRLSVEDFLVKDKDLWKRKEWKLPAVMVMTRRAFETHL
jgi:hypothetical protein